MKTDFDMKPSEAFGVGVSSLIIIAIILYVVYNWSYPDVRKFAYCAIITGGIFGIGYGCMEVSNWMSKQDKKYEKRKQKTEKQR